MNKHTPEPWKTDYISGRTNYLVIDCDTDEDTARVGDTRSLRHIDEQVANANRIVSCVNACAGIPDPEKLIPEMIRLLREGTYPKGRIDRYCPCGKCLLCRCFDLLSQLQPTEDK